METPVFDEMYPSGVVYTAKMAGRVRALKDEHEALKQRCEDLELICETWAQSDEDGNPWSVRVSDGKLLLYAGDEGDTIFELERDARTGLPLLTSEAREALRKAVRP